MLSHVRQTNEPSSRYRISYAPFQDKVAGPYYAVAQRTWGTAPSASSTEIGRFGRPLGADRARQGLETSTASFALRL